MSDDDMIAIARLRGRQLQTFDVPLSCISSLKSESGVEEHECGCVGTDFNDEVKAHSMESEPKLENINFQMLP